MTAKKDLIYRMSPEEIELFSSWAENPNAFFEYWFKKPGGRPFQLDYNFVEEAKWQEDMCMTAKSTIVAICGIGTGKTLAVGLSTCYHATITPAFRFLNIAKELDQSKIMYDLIVEWSENTRFAKLITKKPASPHPKIHIEYIIETEEGDVHVKSLLEFYSAGEMQDAKNILSKRFDWINIEEAGRFDNLSELIGILTTRLTGTSSIGRPLMARMSIISNPIENPELWALFDDAIADPENYAVFLIDTEQNKNVTKEQIAMQLRLIPPEEQDLWLKGERPEGRGAYFSIPNVTACESELLSNILKNGLSEKTPGYHGNYSPALGYFDFRMPRDPMRDYIVVGDPGTGSAPKRNAPVVMALDVTDIMKNPKGQELAFVCALWWGNGRGSIMPWVDMLLYYLKVYRPVQAGCDSTSTQKHSAELINFEYIHGKNYSVSGLLPMDFSGNGKFSLLLSLRLAIEPDHKIIIWPDVLKKSISSQLKNYDLVEDTSSKTAKLPQDLVATLAMGARIINALPRPIDPDPPKATDKNRGNSRESRNPARDGRRAHVSRSRAGR